MVEADRSVVVFTTEVGSSVSKAKEQKGRREQAQNRSYEHVFMRSRRIQEKGWRDIVAIVL